MLYVTHDLTVASQVCDRLYIMYAGRIMETGRTLSVLEEPLHPYTHTLIASVPQGYEDSPPLPVQLGEPPNPAKLPGGCKFNPRCPYVKDVCREEEPQLVEVLPGRYAACWKVDGASGKYVEIEHLTVSFSSKRRASLLRRNLRVKALDDVSLTIRERETFGLTGETGSGKSTLAKVLVGLYRPASGTVRLLGRQIDFKNKKDVAYLRQNIGIVLQDPVRSLNPRLTVKEIISEALIASKTVSKKKYGERIDFITHLVGVTADLLPRNPRELSGGQRQRVSLARALVVPKKLLILDEPTSALDVSIQAQVLNTLKRLKDELDMSYLFITHDINVIRYVSHRLGILFYGKLVEMETSGQ